MRFFRRLCDRMWQEVNCAKSHQHQESITTSVYRTHDNVLGVVSQPFCVDQLNPAGFNVFNVPYKENTCFFPAWETGNLKINMAEADLSPTTFTSSSTSDSDYDISLRIPLKMKTKIYTLKLPVIIIIRPTEKAMQSLNSAGVQRCQSRSTGSSCHPP